MLQVFDWLGCKIFAGKGLLHRALYFFFGLLMLSWLLLLISLLGAAYVVVFRALGIFLVAAAFLILLQKTSSLFTKGRSRFFHYWKASSIGDKTWIALVLATFLLYAIVSLAPASDADSLDYHLGVPLAILKAHRLVLNLDYFHFSMFGFGEMLNMLGLAVGATQFGAFLQYLAFLWMAVAGASLLKVKRCQFGLLLFSIPILLALVSSQKHQLTGIACSSVCFYFIFQRKALLKSKDLVLVLSCFCFVAGLKYSFFISVAALLGYMAIIKAPVFSWRFLGSATGMFIVFLLPLFAYKFFAFQDPFSPILEMFRAHPNPAMSNFNHFVSNYSETAFPFPVGLIFPASLHDITNVFGLSFLLLLLFFFREKFKKEWWIILFLLLTIGLTAPRVSRFFLEPFLWCFPLLLLAQSEVIRRLSVTIAKLQFVVIFPLLLLFFYASAPAVFSNAGREAFLNKNASFYQESRWLKKALPQDAVICTDIRSRALLAHKSFPIEYLYFTSFSDSVQRRHFDSLFYQEYKVGYLVLAEQGLSGKIRKLYGGARIAGPFTFNSGSRNPWNRQEVSVSVYEVKDASLAAMTATKNHP